MEKLTDNQLNKIPDNWRLDHNIRDIEYWFINDSLEIDLILTQTYTNDHYPYWELNFLIPNGGWNSNYKKLENAWKETSKVMKDFN